jgi:uncharacterized protein
MEEGVMREFIEYIAKQLVDTPSAVVVTEEEKEGKVVFKLKVGESDVGKIIGRKGRSAQAMRVLLSAVAAKNGKRAILEVVD